MTRQPLADNQILLQKKNGLSFSAMVILFTAVYCVLFANYWKGWKTEGGTPFTWDVDQYYSYLPATFIHHDLNFDFPNTYWLNVTPEGKKLPRATYGMALMYMPAFLLGYKIAYNSQEKIDGYSEGFVDAVHYGSIFYFICGLLILRSILLRYFKDTTIALCLLCVFFGTNLFYYVLGSGEMPHNYLFFLFTVFIWLSIKWHETPKIKYSLVLGIILGLITLIRPTEILISLVFIFYGIRSKQDFIQAYKNYLFNWKKILTIVFGFFIIWLPQLIYWKMQTGNFFFFSYGEKEGFFFSDPKIIEVLFGYRKGWLIYTPIMIFAIIGMFLSKKYLPKFNLPIMGCFLINLYLISSWWCWWFGGGFGMRALIQHYAFMSFFLCVFIEKIIDWDKFNYLFNNLFKYVIATVFMFFISLNIIQTYQIKAGFMHHDSMTKESYWLVFGKFELTGSENHKYWNNLKAPDYDKAIEGIR